jgi:hypothetical protein
VGLVGEVAARRAILAPGQVLTIRIAYGFGVRRYPVCQRIGIRSQIAGRKSDRRKLPLKICACGIAIGLTRRFPV